MNPEEIKNLSFRVLLDELLNYLEDKSYTQLTLTSYQRTLRKIELFMIEHGINAYTCRLQKSHLGGKEYQ